MELTRLDVTDLPLEFRAGLVKVVGSPTPSAEEKVECVETLSRYAVDGWAIAADLTTPIGQLAARTADAAGVPLLPISTTSPRE